MVESMRCRNCGAAMDAERIDRSLGVVVCSHCGGLHELEPLQAGGVPSTQSPSQDHAHHAAEQSRRLERGTAPLPERFKVDRGDKTLRVVWKGSNRRGAIMMAVFACIWAAATVYVGVPFLAPVSVFLLYYAAVRYVNETELRVSTGRLETRSGPLPWRRSTRILMRADVKQLFAREVVTRSRMESGDSRQMQEFRSYAVVAIAPSGKRKTIIGGFPLPAHALWFEREIEQLFGIEDTPVDAEVR